MSRSDWREHVTNGSGEQTNRIPSISKTTSVELRLADQWIGRNTTLPMEKDPINADLERDLFWTLYRRYNPFKEETDPARVVNQKMVQWLAQGATWDTTHEMTVANRVASAISSEMMKESLLNDPEVKKMLNEQKKVEQEQQQAKQAQEKSEQQSGAGDAAGAAQSKTEADQHNQNAQAMGQALADKAEKFQGSPKAKAMQAGINKQAKDKASETNGQMAGWGMEDGEGEEMDIAQLQDTLNQVTSSGVNHLAELIGRAQGVGMRTLSTRKIAQLVVTDAGLTRNPEDIFSDELMMLSPDIPVALRSLQMGALVDDGLLGIIKAVETKQEGDMVIMVDGSGSMQGDREYTAKAITLGITSAAAENGQHYTIKTFGDGNELTDAITEETDQVMKLKWATFLFGGGTDFDMALNDAIRIVRNLEDPTAADIVMITDGMSQIEPRTANALKSLKQETGTRLIVMLVDTGYGGIDKAADATIMVNSREAIEKAATELSQSLWKSGGTD